MRRDARLIGSSDVPAGDALHCQAVFLVPEANQYVFQFTLVGDERTVTRLFDELIADTDAVAYDVAGSDQHRMRSLRFVSDIEMDVEGELDKYSVALNVTSVATPWSKFETPTISTGKKPARELAVLGLDACIEIVDGRLAPELLGDVPVVKCEVAELGALHRALRAAFDAALEYQNANALEDGEDEER